MTQSYGSSGPEESYDPVSSQGTSATTEPGETGSGVKDKASAAGSAAKEGAGRVMDAEKQMAHDTAHEAKSVAKETVSEARTQAKDLIAQTRDEISRTAGEQLQRLSGTTSSLSSEFGKMASSSDERSLAASLVEQASSYLDKATQWVEGREPGELLDDVKRYASRHPGTFMAIAAGLGLVVGRVARGAKDEHGDDDSAHPTQGTPSTAASAQPHAGGPTPASPINYTSATGHDTTPTAGPSAPDSAQSTAYRSPGYGEPNYQRPGGDSL